MFEFEREYWNYRYTHHEPRGSGAGSYGEPMLRKVEWLSELPGINSIVEIGCGDFNFGKNLTDKLPLAKYDGFDVSDVVIDRNRKAFKASSPRIEFHRMDRMMIQPADLLLCVDVLFHIIDDDEYEEMVQGLEIVWKSGYCKYLAVSAYEYDGTSNAHVRIRKFDPTRFGVPILQETIEQPGAMQFYIFAK